MEAAGARRLVFAAASVLEKSGRFSLERRYLQHGSCSVYRHSVSVALCAVSMALFLRCRLDYESLVRGALLHDYFLYDWHTRAGVPLTHGFTHPRRALLNAESDFLLTACEKDIIAHHMFPLVPVPPATKAGWLVCIADKVCALRETVQGHGNQFLPKTSSK